MSHPFKRYCFHLAEKLKMPITEVMQLSSNEISEWMAYDLTKSDEWVEKYSKEKELERQRNLSNQEKANLFKQLIGGVPK